MYSGFALSSVTIRVTVIHREGKARQNSWSAILYYGGKHYIQLATPTTDWLMLFYLNAHLPKFSTFLENQEISQAPYRQPIGAIGSKHREKRLSYYNYIHCKCYSHTKKHLWHKPQCYAHFWEEEEGKPYHSARHCLPLVSPQSL